MSELEKLIQEFERAARQAGWATADYHESNGTWKALDNAERDFEGAKADLMEYLQTKINF